MQQLKADGGLQHCLYICSAISSGLFLAWFVPLVFSLGFVLGRFRSAKQPTQKCQQHVCLYRSSSIERMLREIVRPALMSKAARSPGQAPKTRMGLEELPSGSQPSPHFSDSGSSSSASPLLAGTRKASPCTSGVSSVENSPVAKSPSLQVCEDVSKFEAPPATPATPTILKSKPEPVCIPGWHVGDDAIPAVAWMCGKGLEGQDVGWLDLTEPRLLDLFGQHWELLIHPDDMIRCKDVIRSALSTRAPFQMEYRLKVHGETFRWVMELAKPMFTLAGVFSGFVGWRIDIHERKLIEDNYWNYWMLPHEYLVNWKGDGCYFDNVSPSFPQLLGYTLEEFLDHPYLHFVHGDDLELTRRAAEQLRGGEKVGNFCNRYRCAEEVEGPVYVDKSGKYKWLQWTANASCGSCRDITADRLGVEDLKKSTEELARLTDLIPGGVFNYRITNDGEEYFTFASKGAQNMLQIQEREDGKICPKREGKMVFGLIVHSDDFPKLVSCMRQCIVAKAAFDRNFRVISKEGDIWWVRVHAVPTVHSDDSTDWSGLALDETQQHEELNALAQAKADAEKVSQAKGTFLAHMSHEIRTPINAVMGMSSFLLETELTPEQLEYALVIQSSSEALLGIINDILDYSKIEAGKADLEVHPTSLLKCVEDALDIVAPQAAAKNLELTQTISESVPTFVLGDSYRIRQILLNLISNAVKFTETGGISVSVDGNKLDGGALESSSSSLSRCRLAKQSVWDLHISVTDSGMGIPEDRRTCLFQPFSQVDASTTRKYGGTGLGLAICSRLAQLHGGHIWVESEPGKGSTFHFTVLAEEAPEDGSKGKSGLQGKRVLIVDHCNSSTQAMCAQLLKRWHLRTVCTFRSEEALKLLEKVDNSFDVVVFNCSLFDAADSQGEKCLALCKRPEANLPTLLLTSGGVWKYYTDSQTQLHFDAYVSKPVKQSSLYNALMSVAGEGKPSYANQDLQVASPSKLLETGKMYPLEILVAEDNLVNQKVIVSMLQRLGYKVDVVGDGKKALDAVASKNYDVCLMDCVMPVMDGLEASRRIKKTIHPSPMIVAVTAGALEEERQACLQAGMDMWLCKPISKEALLSTLKQCWNTKSSSM